MFRFMFKDIDSINIITLVRWMCRIAFAGCFGMTFAIVLIFARWSIETKQRDQTTEFTALRLQVENDQLRQAIAEMSRNMKPVKGGNKSVGGE